MSRPHPVRTVPFLLFVLASFTPVAGEERDSLDLGLDFSEDEVDVQIEVGVEIVDWEPMVPRFELRPDVDRPEEQTLESLPTLQQAWEALKPRIAPIEFMTSEQEIISGWRWNGGRGFIELQGPFGTGKSVRAGLYMVLDVLMPAKVEPQKEEILNRYFRLACKLELYRLGDPPPPPRSDDPATAREELARILRTQAPADPERRTLFQIGGDVGLERWDEVQTVKLQDTSERRIGETPKFIFIDLLQDVDLRTAGIYELRLRYRVEGQMGPDDPPIEKPLEAAVRLVRFEEEFQTQVLFYRRTGP